MSFISGTDIACDYVYTDDELCAIEPKHVLRWMNLRAFGTVNPGVDDNPISARSNTLAYWKKAIPFFHPKRLMVWSFGRKEGNSRRSVEINNLIKRVKKKEVRKKGVRSQTWRAITEREFRALHAVLCDDSRSMLCRYDCYDQLPVSSDWAD